MDIQPLQTINEKVMQLLLLADPSEEMIERYLNHSFKFALYKETEIIGVVLCQPLTANQAEIVNIAVKESEQGKGYGGKLLSFTIDFCQTAGYHELIIRTGNSSIPQLQLYKTCGFTISGVDKDFFIKMYDEPIYENGLQCRDQITLIKQLDVIY